MLLKNVLKNVHRNTCIKKKQEMHIMLILSVRIGQHPESSSAVSSWLPPPAAVVAFDPPGCVGEPPGCAVGLVPPPPPPPPAVGYGFKVVLRTGGPGLGGDGLGLVTVPRERVVDITADGWVVVKDGLDGVTGSLDGVKGGLIVIMGGRTVYIVIC